MWGPLLDGAALFLISLVVDAVLLFGTVFGIIMLSDYECDYINSIDLCPRMNQLLLPEYIVHWVLTLVFLLDGNFSAFSINLPLAAYHLRLFLRNKHRFDETQIYHTIDRRKRESLYKLGFYLLCFFYYLYRMIVGLLVRH